MVNVRSLFMELYYEVFKISVLHAFTDSIIFFMISLNITTLLAVKYYFALIASALFMLADVLVRVKHTTLREVEEKNPQVKDILRTARDNMDSSDFMVLAMFEDLIQKMKSVSAGTLLNFNRLMVKTIIVCVLSYSVIMVSANNIHVPKYVFDPDTYYQWFAKQGNERLDFYTIDFNESDELLYGDPDLADLGNKTIDIKIAPSINEISFGNVKDPDEKEFEKGTFPDEMAAVSDASSEETLPKESKIAIAYNLKLKNTTSP